MVFAHCNLLQFWSGAAGLHFFPRVLTHRRTQRLVSRAQDSRKSPESQVGTNRLETWQSGPFSPTLTAGTSKTCNTFRLQGNNLSDAITPEEECSGHTSWPILATKPQVQYKHIDTYFRGTLFPPQHDISTTRRLHSTTIVSTHHRACIQVAHLAAPGIYVLIQGPPVRLRRQRNDMDSLNGELRAHSQPGTTKRRENVARKTRKTRCLHCVSLSPSTQGVWPVRTRPELQR